MTDIRTSVQAADLRGPSFSRRTALGQMAAAMAAAFTGGFGTASFAHDTTTSGITFGEAEAFNGDTLKALAKDLAAQPYVAPREISADWKGLTYDQIREIWFDGKHALFSDTDSPVRSEMFAAGLYQHHPVHIYAVQNGQAREVEFDLELFTKTDRFPVLPEEGSGFSGFRLTGELITPGQFQEYAVFQGASYFRAVAAGQQYGLSARGLALNTASATKGEEFPMFTKFWIEQAAPGSTKAVVYALLDSASVTGAYRFEIEEGEETIMEVDATLYPRVTLDEIGIAPETSMFLFNDLNRVDFDDFREGVHDSDGLLIANSKGELVWRPLDNPKHVETSWFHDENPRGFGLMQRARDLASYNDLAAHYERRPSLWVEPKGQWGAGHVALIEIPADKEIYDNIVAFWRPDAPLEAGGEYTFGYTLYWADGAPPVDGERARVLATRTGERVFEPGRMFAIDFEAHPALGDDPEELEARVSATVGEITGVLVLPNPATGGVRVDVTILLPEDKASELRVELWRGGDSLVSEVWLYRWVP